MKTAKKVKGFTLIELLVVMTIGIIVFATGFAGYRDFSRRQTLSGISKQIKADLRTAQQLAITGQKPQGATCTRLVSYDFDRISSTNYQITATCDNNGIIPPPITIKNINLITGMTIASTSDPISFKVLGMGTNLSGDATITISFTQVTNPETIVIGKGGDIK